MNSIPEHEKNILELQGVTRSFEGFTLNDVSFALPKGFIMGLIGPNGAGKTTTIKLILNMLSPEGGKIRVFGKDNVLCEQEIKERIGVVMDRPFYVDEWTLLDVDKALSLFYRKWDSAKYRKTLNDFNVEPRKKVKELSRGMKMKLMIAAAISHDADLLILDEPTGGLDAIARNELMDILGGFICNESKGVLFSTHITADLDKIADYITFINKGKILYTGTKDDLREHYCVVKGGIGVLNDEQRKHIYGYSEHSVGFDGLIETSKLGTLPRSVIAEPAGFDELIIKMGGTANE